jgi:hypothetical protein
LIDDNVAFIVKEIEDDRLIFDNMKKSIAYPLVAKPPELAPFSAFIVAKIPQAMSVILILSIDLGCDLLTAISLAFESPEADIVLCKPRNASTDLLFNRRLGYVSITLDKPLRDVRNLNITTGFEPGQGCFELWTSQKQRAAIENGLTSFFVAVVVC